MSMDEELSPTERAFMALEFLARANSLTLRDLTDTLGMSRSAAFRLLTNLEAFGYTRKSATGTYAIAPRLLDLASDISRLALQSAAVHAILMELTAEIGESSSLATLNHNELEYIDSAASDSRLAFQFQTGQRAPLHCTSSGRVILSLMSKRDLARYMASAPWTKHTEFTLTSPEQLTPIILETRRTGYALTDSEYTLGVIGAAVPVYSLDKKLIACLSISAPKARKSADKLRGIIPVLRAAAERISKCVSDPVTINAEATEV